MAAGDYRGDRNGDYYAQQMWQLNAIRQAVQFLAALAAIGVVLSFMAAVSGT